MEAKFRDHKVAHFYENADQEFSSAHKGMWLFLGQEVLFFAVLFVAYVIFRTQHSGAFIYGSHVILDWKLGFVNTLVLIGSSFTMVMAVRSAQLSKKNATVIYLVFTLLCACIFMGIKYVEYSHKFHDGFLPGDNFSGLVTQEGLNKVAALGYDLEVIKEGVKYLYLFFSVYFMVTGLHGIHILIGMGLLVWLIIRSVRGDFHSKHYTALEMFGLYWHLVDLIWIFLFPLLYLI